MQERRVRNGKLGRRRNRRIEGSGQLRTKEAAVMLRSMTSTRGEIQIDWQLPENFRIHTERLDLVPGSAQLANTDWRERDYLSELLGVQVPNQWPPELVVDRRSTDGSAWWDWYVVKRDVDRPILIGVAGIKGWPAVTGDVQLGCAFLPQFQGSGYGTEAVNGLTSWSLTHPHVDRVIAETPVGNNAAAGVLRKLGFELLSSHDEEGLLRFQKTRGENNSAKIAP
jgi:RimJ/RimL family protein N-acetyltransferase